MRLLVTLVRLIPIVFDKTGTLTIGHPVLRYEAYFELDKIEIIPYIYSIEKQSDHPLAKAITGHIKDAKTLHIDHTDVIKGGGIVASIHKKRVLVGNLVLMKDNGIEIKSDIMDEINRLEHEGHSIVLTAIDEKLVSLMGIRDEVRPNLVKDLKRIKKMGVKNLIVLSGDNQGSVDIVAKELGLSKAVGNMLPEDKANYIKKLMSEGHMIAFVGDGVNDSPSIALAHIGIAMGGGTDVAIETSDVVLMNDNINKLPHALGLAKATKHNMIQNILIAIGVVVVLLVSLFLGRVGQYEYWYASS